MTKYWVPVYLAVIADSEAEANGIVYRHLEEAGWETSLIKTKEDWSFRAMAPFS